MINPLYVNINIFKNPYILKQNQLVRGIFQIFFSNFFNVCNRRQLDYASYIPFVIREMTSLPVTQPLENSTVYS